MFQFSNYPIYVVYSLHRQQAVDPIARQYGREMKQAGDSAVAGVKARDFDRFQRQIAVYREKRALIYATSDWELIEDIGSKYTGEIRDYENRIRHILTTISHTSVGQMLLRHISHSPSNSKIWIVPATWTNLLAKTEQMMDEEGGGIRIRINPAPLGADAEETLFHELVHAKRYAWNQFHHHSFEGKEINSDFNGSSEEFIATQLENVYHASRGFSDKYSAYLGSSLRKDAMYQYIAENYELTQALKYFLDNDLLVKEAASLKQPEYNPFRDIAAIQKAAHIGDEYMKTQWTNDE
ncbi:MAG: M91 family zinc metallopeptidase [Acidobacteriota bacterium]